MVWNCNISKEVELFKVQLISKPKGVERASKAAAAGGEGRGLAMCNPKSLIAPNTASPASPPQKKTKQNKKKTKKTPAARLNAGRFLPSGIADSPMW